MKNNVLIERRNLLGYSQQDVANLIGIDRTYYTKIESGLAPSVKVAKALGQHLGVDWTIFFDNVCEENAQTSSQPNSRKEVS